MLFVSITLLFQILLILDLNGNIPCPSTINIDELTSALNTRSAQPSNVPVFNEKKLFISYAATQMFQAPAVVTMTIASTRMHRSLVDSASSSDVYASLSVNSSPAYHGQCQFSVQESFQVSKLKFATPKQSRATPAPLSPMETTIRTVSGQHLTPQLGDRDPSINIGDRVSEKRNESSPGEDLERGM